jgi:opacity protein-like surface antigen
MSFFGKFCTPHPDTWGALLQGLVISGDRGPRIFKTLRAAMAQPYNYLAMSGFSEEVLDKARSRVLGALLRGVLAAPEQGSRLGVISETAAALLQQSAAAADINSSTSSSSSSSIHDSLAEGLQGTRGAFMAALDVSVATASKAAVLNAAGSADTSSSLSASTSSSSSGRSTEGWLPAVQQAVPGLPLQLQPVHTRLQVLVVLQILQVMKGWGVSIQHDAALAAALQVLRFCWDTEDARQSGEPDTRLFCGTL